MATAKIELPHNGIYVRGVVISNQAFAFQRKDGSGIVVKLSHELALQPGVAVFERYVDPKEDQSIKLEGETVTEFPRYKDFESLTLKVLKVRQDKDRLVISSAEQIG